jgi:hypothetical protein
VAIYKFTHPSGTIRIVAAPDGDEARAREVAAGRGKDRDESYLDHNGGATFEVLKDTADKVLLEYADPAAKTEAPAKEDKAEK